MPHLLTFFSYIIYLFIYGSLGSTPQFQFVYPSLSTNLVPAIAIDANSYLPFDWMLGKWNVWVSLLTAS